MITRQWDDTYCGNGLEILGFGRTAPNFKKVVIFLKTKDTIFENSLDENFWNSGNIKRAEFVSGDVQMEWCSD